MKLTVNGESHDFDPASITNREAMAIEKVTGMTFGQWSDALKERSVLAMTAMVWVVQRRSQPALRFSDVDFALGALTVATDDVAETEQVPGVDPTEASRADVVTTESPGV